MQGLPAAVGRQRSKEQLWMSEQESEWKERAEFSENKAASQKLNVIF